MSEAVVGVVVQVDGSIDLLQTVQMLLYYVKTVLPTLSQIHGARYGFKTLSRNPVEFIHLWFFFLVQATYVKECAREKQV